MSCYLEVNGYIERVVTLQERTRVRQHPVSGTSEEPLGERNGGHRPRGESFTRDAAPPAEGGGGGLRSRGRLHLHNLVLSVTTLLVKPTWLLSKLHIHRPKRNKKLLGVKMKVLWQYLPLSLRERSKQRTPFFLT